MFTLRSFLNALACLALVLSSTAIIAPAVDVTPVRVVTGNTVVQDIAVRIGGERIQATCLLQPGIDPHAYQPVPEDVKRLASAQLVIINGLGFEGWFEGLAKEAGYRGVVVRATSGITPLKMADDHDHDHPPAAGDDAASHEALVDDPHAFNSIVHGVRYAENIRDALIAADATGAEGYRSRATAYVAELRKVDAWAKKEIATKLPPASRKLITNHDALQYFAKDYGFTIRAPNTALEDSQPSAQDLAALVTFITREGVKGVFLEVGKNQKVVEQIAQEAGVRIGGELYLDGVGPAGSPAATYIGMFQTNVTTIVGGLQ
ncbi:MAG: zinc ABC transporter substrate-binding protein [Planctomycetes bacterium]|nr:zinc ABC transporter substrate-binding protein [Planctomycetota bacterium]